LLKNKIHTTLEIIFIKSKSIFEMPSLTQIITFKLIKMNEVREKKTNTLLMLSDVGSTSSRGHRMPPLALLANVFIALTFYVIAKRSKNVKKKVKPTNDSLEFDREKNTVIIKIELIDNR
jgi:hypothetical protein